MAYIPQHFNTSSAIEKLRTISFVFFNNNTSVLSDLAYTRDVVFLFPERKVFDELEYKKDSITVIMYPEKKGRGYVTNFPALIDKINSEIDSQIKRHKIVRDSYIPDLEKVIIWIEYYRTNLVKEANEFEPSDNHKQMRKNIINKLYKTKKDYEEKIDNINNTISKMNEYKAKNIIAKQKVELVLAGWEK